VNNDRFASKKRQWFSRKSNAGPTGGNDGDHFYMAMRVAYIIIIIDRARSH
jgi:hypothetical protein